MLYAGLTGGIGAGKSAVATRLACHGAIVVDADALAREVVAVGTSGLREVVEVFGADVVDESGELDRAKLAEQIFANRSESTAGDPAAGGHSARRKLEAIIHPRVRARTAELVAAAPGDSIVVNDVPLLAEVNLAPTFDLVIVVEASRDLRLRRLEGRGLSADHAAARIDAQTDDAWRREVADVVLDNSGSVDRLHGRVDELWRDRLAPFEENKRLRRLARRPEELARTLVDYDPAWTGRFRRLAARLRHVLGDVALRMDHVGSTAVPGLIAKDVIDVQVCVPDLAAADAVAETLAESGFPRYEHIRHDDPSPLLPKACDREKRVHGGCDPGNVTHVHLRPIGAPAWRHVLMFRDWLRADSEAKTEYAACKRAIAESRLGTADYAQDKKTWFDQALPRMREWSEAVDWTPPQSQ